MPDKVIDLRQNAGSKTKSKTKASQHPVATPKHLRAKRGCHSTVIGLDPYVYVSANGVNWKLCMDVVEAFRWRHIKVPE